MKEAQNPLTVTMKKDQCIYQTMSVLKKRIRLFTYQKSFQKLRSHFCQMSISLSTANSFQGFTTMLERLDYNITKKEWVLDGANCYGMVVLLN